MADKYTNEDRAREYKEIEERVEELPVLTEAEAINEQLHGRPAAHLLEGLPTADDVPSEVVEGPENTENANLEDQESGTYEEAKAAAEEAREEALEEGLDPQAAAEAVTEAMPDDITEAELQDAEHRGMVQPAENPRNEAQKELLEQQIEEAEDGETTEEGLRKPDEVDEDADEAPKYDTVDDAKEALKDADRAEAEAALKDERKGVREAAQARLDALGEE